MSYVRKDFEDGKILYASELNNLHDGIEEALSASGAYRHAIPKTLGMLNAVKRAKQFTDVQWAPIAKMPGVILTKEYNWNSWADQDFVAGQVYTGVPYSGGVINTNTYVGLNIGLDSFVTAVQNPNSVLYTKSQNHTKGDTYFGTVCSKFAQYVLDIPGSYSTSAIPQVEGIAKVADANKYTEYDIELCDILLYPSVHTAVVTDLIYDHNGRIAFVEVSEAYPPCCQRIQWPIAEFYTRWLKDCALYRYEHLYSTPYIQNDYVNVETETGAVKYFDCALMPEYGDKYNYARTSTATGKVHILKTNYSKAVIKRDDAVIDEITLTSATTQFTFPLNVEGLLEMYLEDADGNKSESVYACVVKATVTVKDFSGGNLTVAITGTSGVPWYAMVGSRFIRLDGKGDATVEGDTASFKVSGTSGSVTVAYKNDYGIYYSSAVSF